MEYFGISLFSGAFGLDIGLEMAGITTALAVDFDKDCVNTLQANNRPAILADIKDMISKDPSCKVLLKKAGLQKKELFLISGGPPCQSFSTAGKMLSVQDPRGMLIYDYLKVVDKLKPRFFVLENVRGLLSVKNKDREGERLIDVLIKKFNNVGYKVVSGLLDSVNYGAPQHRDRLFIIGSRDGESIFLPEPSNFKFHQNPSLRWQTLEDSIRDLEDDPGECMYFSDKRRTILEKIPEGGNWKDLPKSLQKKVMGGAFNSSGGRTSFLRRLNYSMPSPTLMTSPVQKSTTLCHPTKNRPLSIKEYLRIQQFPESWVLTGSLSSKYKQLGNAVPVGLGKAIGEMFISVAQNDFKVQSKKKLTTISGNGSSSLPHLTKRKK